MIFHSAKFKTTGQAVVMQNSALTCVSTTKLQSKISKHIGILCKIQRFFDMNTLINTNVSFICFSISHLLR